MSTKRNNLFLTLFLTLASVACKNDRKTTTSESRPSARPDTVAAESQKMHLDKEKKALFLPSGAAKVISYSFLDIHDYEFDSALKGQLLRVMPEYSQYLRKDDPHPKTILTKSETQKLLCIINTANTYARGGASCYFPRNCFVFYNSKDEITGYYEICFECGRISSFPEFKLARKGGLSDFGLAQLRSFCQRTGITVHQNN